MFKVRRVEPVQWHVQRGDAGQLRIPADPTLDRVRPAHCVPSLVSMVVVPLAPGTIVAISIVPRALPRSTPAIVRPIPIVWPIILLPGGLIVFLRNTIFSVRCSGLMGNWLTCYNIIANITWFILLRFLSIPRPNSSLTSFLETFFFWKFLTVIEVLVHEIFQFWFQVDHVWFLLHINLCRWEWIHVFLLILFSHGQARSISFSRGLGIVIHGILWCVGVFSNSIIPKVSSWCSIGFVVSIRSNSGTTYLLLLADNSLDDLSFLHFFFTCQFRQIGCSIAK